MYGYIYITKNLINGKRYIGQHKSKTKDKYYLGSGIILNKAIRKYGRSNFKLKIIYSAESNEELDFAEKTFIKAFNAVKNPLFYNIHEGGTGGNTKAGYTPEQREKYRDKFRGKNNPMYNIGNKHPLYGIGHTEDTKIKISENHADVSGVNNPRARVVVLTDDKLNIIEEFELVKTALKGEWKKKLKGFHGDGFLRKCLKNKNSFEEHYLLYKDDWEEMKNAKNL